MSFANLLKPIRSHQRKPREMNSEPEQVRQLHKKCSPVVNEAPTRVVQEIAAGVRGQWQTQILQIAVVANIQSRVGMYEVGEEEIGVEVFGALQRRKRRIRQHGTVRLLVTPVVYEAARQALTERGFSHRHPGGFDPVYDPLLAAVVCVREEAG